MTEPEPTDPDLHSHGVAEVSYKADMVVARCSCGWESATYKAIAPLPTAPGGETEARAELDAHAEASQ